MFTAVITQTGSCLDLTIQTLGTLHNEDADSGNAFLRHVIIVDCQSTKAQQKKLKNYIEVYQDSNPDLPISFVHTEDNSSLTGAVTIGVREALCSPLWHPDYDSVLAIRSGSLTPFGSNVLIYLHGLARKYRDCLGFISPITSGVKGMRDARTMLGSLGISAPSKYMDPPTINEFINARLRCNKLVPDVVPTNEPVNFDYTIFSLAALQSVGPFTGRKSMDWASEARAKHFLTGYVPTAYIPTFRKINGFNDEKTIDSYKTPVEHSPECLNWLNSIKG